MFTLVTDRSKYFRVKRGQSGEEVESVLCCPVFGKAFCGAIIETGEKLTPYIALPLENYNTVARKFGVSAEELKRVTRSKPVYPSCKLFVPCKK